MKAKVEEKAKLCYMDTDLTVYQKTRNIFIGIAKHVKTRFDPSNYELDNHCVKETRQLSVIGLIKDELGGEIMSFSHQDQKHIAI